MSSLLLVTRTFAVLAVGFSSLCALTASGVIMPTANTTQVTGRLTYSGGPVQQATIIFTPNDSRSSESWGMAVTDADGNFEVSEGNAERGLRPGSYAVHLLRDTPDPPGGADAAVLSRRRIPARFYD